MDRLSVTTHLLAVLTAFSAFTMPIALEVLNRVKSRYGSAYYMDSIEQIMGFKIEHFFRELIVTLGALIFFILFVSSIDKALFKDSYILLSEILFCIIACLLLMKEVRFIKTVFYATRSDMLVTSHLIAKLRNTCRWSNVWWTRFRNIVAQRVMFFFPSHLTRYIENRTGNISHKQEIELLVQMACFSIENTAYSAENSIENRLFRLIEMTSMNQDDPIDSHTIKELVDVLATILTSARNTNIRGKYVSLQRFYGRLWVLFFDRKIKRYDAFEMTRFYEESIKELSSGQYWLLKADFLIGIDTSEIQSPKTITFIDSHVRSLIDFLVSAKPELLPELIKNYRDFISYESYFDDDIHELTNLFGSYNDNYANEVLHFTEAHKELLKSDPDEYINCFNLLLDKHVKDALTTSVSVERHKEILETKIKYQKRMLNEIIKKIGVYAAKGTAQYTLRKLANKRHWGCILDCHESFSPAHSKARRLGVNLLPASLNSMIKQLGQAYSYSLLDFEEHSHAFIRTIPILVPVRKPFSP